MTPMEERLAVLCELETLRAVAQHDLGEATGRLDYDGMSKAMRALADANQAIKRLTESEL